MLRIPLMPTVLVIAAVLVVAAAATAYTAVRIRSNESCLKALVVTTTQGRPEDAARYGLATPGECKSLLPARQNVPGLLR